MCGMKNEDQLLLRYAKGRDVCHQTILLVVWAAIPERCRRCTSFHRYMFHEFRAELLEWWRDWEHRNYVQFIAPETN